LVFHGLITDLDGTLVRLPINWNKIRSKVRRILRTNHHLKPLATTIPMVARGRKFLERLAYTYIELEELKAVKYVVYDENLYSLLKEIKERKMKIALVTLQAYTSTDKILRKLRVRNFFDLIVTRDLSVNRLEQLKYAIKKLKLNPRNTIFVGDMPWDHDAGITLGLYTIIVGNNVPHARRKIEKFIEIKNIIFH